MMIDHVAIWTSQLDRLRDYYVKWFNGFASPEYTNKAKQFESCFITFESGTRLELMKMPGIPENLNDPVEKQYQGISSSRRGFERNPKLLILACGP